MMGNNPWIDTRLSEEEMNFLRNAISKENIPSNSVEKIEKKWRILKILSKTIIDKDNWFYETVLKKLTERMLYRDWGNYYKYQVEKEVPLPKFKLREMWVNYQKQHAHNPLHNHEKTGLFSFVVFIKIPTHWKKQHELSVPANFNIPCASDFQFLLGLEGGGTQTISIKLCPEDEGRILFFPSWLLHQVYPFYETDELRITVAGNIDLLQRSVK